MKNSKKITAVVLAAAMLVTMTGCNGNKTAGGTGDSTPDVSQTFAEVTAAPIDTTAPTGTIKWLVYEDLLTNNATMVTKFESEYNATIEQQITGSGPEYFETLGTLIAADDSPDIVRYEWMSFPHGMSYNMYTPVDSYIDLDSDLWVGVKDVAEQFVYNGKHYYAPYQLVDNFSLNYNKLVLEDAGLDDPMELYLNDEWTWSAFQSLITKWCDLSEDHIGYTGVGAMSFVATTGTKLIDVVDGQIVNNMKSENVSRCMQFLEGLFKENLVGTGYVSPQEAFVDGNLLFLGMQASWAYAAAAEALDKQGIDAEMAFIPFPRDENADKYYCAIGSFGYLVPAGAPNVKGAVDWIVFNRVEETDPENLAKAESDALNTDPVYFPKCANSDCGDTSENADAKGRHIFTDEENEAGVDTCPVCGAARKEKFHASYTEDQWNIYQEMKSTDGRLTMLFDHCYGFSADLKNMLDSGTEGDGTGSILNGSIFHGDSYTTICASQFDAVESYLQPYRDRMAADAATA